MGAIPIRADQLRAIEQSRGEFEKMLCSAPATLARPLMNVADGAGPDSIGRLTSHVVDVSVTGALLRPCAPDRLLPRPEK